MTESTEQIQQTSSEELLNNFRQRYEALMEENRQLTAKLKENEATALKLLGGIETLQYLNKDTEEETED